ncbi:hypothetical protein [Actinokineospora sp.]
MAGLLNRIKGFLRSPQGRQLADKAKAAARDPRTRQKARDTMSRFRRKR